MNRKLLIAGAGQLGSRYLQGLSKVGEPLDIFVYDLSVESLVRARQRWEEMQPALAHDVKYISSLSSLPEAIDLVIVATTADVRASLVAEISKNVNVRNWVLEKVLAQNTGELQSIQRAIGRWGNAWVNTPMYLWSLYRRIRDLYPKEIPIDASFEGFRGLACNAIHYVDFVSRWNNSRLGLVDVSGLKTEWYPAKRAGFFEIDGELFFRFLDGSTLRLVSDSNNLGYKVKLRIAGDEWSVFESEGVARASDGRSIDGGIEYQSQLTAPMVQAIFSGMPCGLPSLAESVEQHTPFLSALLRHWGDVMPSRVERLPIT